MKAIVLTYDKNRQLLRHMLYSHEVSGAFKDIQYLIPWNELYPKDLIDRFGKDKIIPVKCEVPIKKTMDTLLSHVEDNEWIYWCMEDNFIEQVDLKGVLKAFEWIKDHSTEKDYGIQMFTGHHDIARNTISTNNILKYDSLILHKKNKISYQWRAQFCRAKVIKTMFRCLDEPEYMKQLDYMLLEDRGKPFWDLIKEGNFYTIKPSVVILGEQVNKNKLTKNCAESFKKYNLELPKDIEVDENMRITVPNIRDIKSNFRLDYFLVWGHGFNFFTKIIDTINSCDDLDILSIEKREIEDIDNFIQFAYAKEWHSVPKAHTISKTRFLLHPDIPKKAGIILVMNKKPDVRIQDNKNPLFRMPESGTIKDIKIKIREKFDPNKGGRGQIPIIPGHNPDQHVIHASDFEEQVENILEIFGMKNYDSWFTYWKNKYQPTNGINTLVKNVKLDSIQLRILDNNGDIRICKIEDSPHYKFLCGDTQEYEEYWERFSGIYLKEDHSPNSFKKLAKDFDYLRSPYDTSYIKIKGSGNNYGSLDGDHRLCILKSQQRESIKVEVSI